MIKWNKSKIVYMNILKILLMRQVSHFYNKEQGLIHQMSYYKIYKN